MIVTAVRQQRPLVHCITAAVTMNLVASGLLASGARPMMTETDAEAPVITGGASALLINLGTLSTDAMTGIPATYAANRGLGLPVVLDPTAIGRAPVRTRLARDLVRQGVTAIRCNASEVAALAGGTGGSGPDATIPVGDVAEAARQVALTHRTVAAVSGPEDLITDGSRTLRLPGGSPLQPLVPGTGCLLGALVAACIAVSPDDVFTATATAHAWLAAAAEQAHPLSAGPGEFAWRLLDGLHLVTAAEVASVMARIRPHEEETP